MLALGRLVSASPTPVPNILAGVVARETATPRVMAALPNSGIPGNPQPSRTPGGLSRQIVPIARPTGRRKLQGVEPASLPNPFAGRHEASCIVPRNQCELPFYATVLRLWLDCDRGQPKSPPERDRSLPQGVSSLP